MSRDWQKLKKKLQELDSNKIRTYLLNLNPYVLGIWIIINLAIPSYGALLYIWQYEFYPPIFWIFIPDSSSYALLFGFFLICTLALKKNIQVLNIITFIGLVKVFFGYIMLIMLIPSFFDLVSFLAHTFELMEGLLILPFIKTDFKNFSVASTILTLDWFFDFLNPFYKYPTLALYQQHELYNPVGTKPVFWQFFLLFSVITCGLLIYLRLKHWSDEVNWIESVSIG